MGGFRVKRPSRAKSSSFSAILEVPYEKLPFNGGNPGGSEGNDHAPEGAIVSETLANCRDDFVCAPEFSAHNERRKQWLSERRSELCRSFGAVSYGVGAILSNAAWLYAGAEFCAEKAARTADMSWFKMSAHLSKTARSHELAAWELSVREARARQAAEPSNACHLALIAALEAETSSGRGPSD